MLIDQSNGIVNLKLSNEEYFTLRKLMRSVQIFYAKKSSVVEACMVHREFECILEHIQSTFLDNEPEFFNDY